MPHQGSYINGKWVTGSGKVQRNLNPADLTEVVAEFPAAQNAEALAAIAAAEAAWPMWKALPAPERGRILSRAAAIARTRIDEIATLLTREEGKILAEAKGEVIKGINCTGRRLLCCVQARLRHAADGIGLRRDSRGSGFTARCS
jgi:aldehyde dehydrogenase (NAD+)